MGQRSWRKAVRVLAVPACVLLMLAQPAFASDPLPGDAQAPPPDVNIVLYYNIFNNAGAIEPPHGDGYGQHTRVALDIQALRYIRTFTAGGMLAGVQVVQPFVSFVGKQVEGVPLMPPDYTSPGRLTLSSSGGFIQPSFGAFIFPVANKESGTYAVVGFWFSPPIGQYDENANLSVTQNLWTGELEAGTHLTLAGSPAGRNLGLEAWAEGYVYGANGHATLAGIGGTGPASLSEQPTAQLRLYLPYVFYPQSGAAIVPGFFQSFGGKQVYTLPGGYKVDAETRTQESQLRLIAMTWLSPHWQVLVNAQYDIVAHGGPLNRTLELRLGAIF